MTQLKHILLVDDDATTNFFNQYLIEQNKAAEKVTAMTNAIEALDWLETCPTADYPELILLDINMPGMSGFEFANNFGALPSKNEQTVILLLSTSEHHQDATLTEENPNVASLIVKPMSAQTLEKMIERHCNPA